jgi:hypothetical protein
MVYFFPCCMDGPGATQKVHRFLILLDMHMHRPTKGHKWDSMIEVYRTLAKEGPLRNVGPPPSFGSISC